MLQKFQEFAIKGNAFDLAVGDIFMPMIGTVTRARFRQLLGPAVAQGHC
jgi:large-conductance mechanosensitive channel